MRIEIRRRRMAGIQRSQTSGEERSTLATIARQRGSATATFVRALELDKNTSSREWETLMLRIEQKPLNRQTPKL